MGKIDEDIIQIFATGGTFDKEYDEINGKLYFKDTHLEEILKLGRCTLPIALNSLMMIDSLDMGNHEREIIIDACKNSLAKRIIITHGTDTMTQTAQAIAQHIQNKTIILTGAMIPYTFGSSDGYFNIGSALAYVQSMPFGVYVVMNGKCFNSNNVLKNKATGFFESIN